MLTLESSCDVREPILVGLFEDFFIRERLLALFLALRFGTALGDEIWCLASVSSFEVETFESNFLVF